MTNVNFTRSKSLPQPIGIQDPIGNQPFVSVFGDLYTIQRQNYISEQFQYGLNTYSIKTTTTGGTVQVTTNVLTLDATTTGEVSASTKKSLRYSPGSEGYAQFTAAWDISGAGSDTYTAYAGMWDAQSGFIIGFKDGEFYAGYRSYGVDYLTPRSSFTLDNLQDFDLNNLNIFKITYGYLGIAPITFWIRSKTEGWVPFHQTSKINSGLTTHVSTPTLPIRFAINKTGNGDIKMYSASWSAGTVEETNYSQRYFSAESSKTISANTLTNLLTIRSKTTHPHLSLINYIETNLRLLALASEGTKPVGITILKNAILGGTPVWNDIDTTNSIIELDTAGTTVTGGVQVSPYTLAKSDSVNIGINQDLIPLFAGESITIAAVSTAQSELKTGLRWEEKF